MFTDSWIYRGFMRFDLWTKQHGGQGIDRRKMHSFEFGHLRGDYLGLNIVLRSFVMQRWISMKDHTTLCLHAKFVATHAKPPLSLISRWNKEHDVDFWQPPDISRSHLYRGTFPWTPTTAIYRAYKCIYRSWNKAKWHLIKYAHNLCIRRVLYYISALILFSFSKSTAME